jgi:hypothetical protein
MVKVKVATVLVLATVAFKGCLQLTLGRGQLIATNSHFHTNKGIFLLFFSFGF